MNQEQRNKTLTLGCGRNRWNLGLCQPDGVMDENLFMRHVLTCRHCQMWMEAVTPIIKKFAPPPPPPPGFRDKALELYRESIPRDEWSKRLMSYRIPKYMMQADVARKLGVSTNVVWRWEHGDRIPGKNNQRKILDLTEGRKSRIT